MVSRRLFPGIAVALLATATAGCVGPRATSSTTPEQLAANAVVVVSVSHSREARRQAEVRFTIDGGSDLRVLDTFDEIGGIPSRNDFNARKEYGRVYILLMPPGRHQFTSWSIKQGSMRLNPKEPPKPLPFESRVGSVVYLGNLHMNLTVEPGLLPGSKTAVDAQPEVRDLSETDIPIAVKRNPAINGKVQKELLPVGNWALESGGIDKTFDPLIIPVTPKK